MSTHPYSWEKSKMGKLIILSALGIFLAAFIGSTKADLIDLEYIANVAQSKLL